MYSRIINKIINVSHKKLKRDWWLYKKLIRRTLKERNIEESFRLLENMSYYAYKYNFIPSFSDLKVEESIDALTKMCVEPIQSIDPIQNRLIFYDYFCLENRGFTEVYIDYFVRAGLDFLYIVGQEDQYNENNYIIKKIKLYEKSSVYVIPKNFSRQEQVNSVLTKVLLFRPSKLFIHNSPWDILSCCLGVALRNSNIHSYLINITDHAYWSGKCAFDYVINFRKYGYILDRDYRKIPTEKLYLIPTPPYQGREEPFQGFPINTANKVIGFSGGSFYKILDEEKTFLNLLKNVIENNLNFIFLFANIGGDIYLEDFINDNNLQGRFILLGNRKDINEVFKNIDIYFNTYPYGGGMMIEYARSNHKPIIAYHDSKLIYTRIDYVIDKYLPDKFLISNLSEYLSMSSKLIQDEDFRKNYTKELVDGENKKERFEIGITQLLNGPPINNDELGNNHIAINLSAIVNFHIKSDTLYYKEYLEIINKGFKNLNMFYKSLFVYLPKFFVRIASHSFYSAMKGIFKRLLYSVIKKIYPIVDQIKKERELYSYEMLLQKFQRHGKNCKIDLPAKIYNPQYIQIGDNFYSLYNLRLEAWDEYEGEKFSPSIEIGNNVSVGTDCHIGAINKIIIGNNVLIASRVYISDHFHGSTSQEALSLPPSKRPLVSKGIVVIEDNVWIGEGVCILPSVRIGANSIIGANAVITKDVPANAVVGGIPAKIINILS